MAEIELGALVCARADIHSRHLIAWKAGEKARVVGFILNAARVDVMVEDLEGNAMDQFPAEEFASLWGPSVTLH
jgi:hypothetical protein